MGEGVDGDQGGVEVVDGVLVQVGDGEVRQDVVPRLLVEVLVAGDEQRVHRRDDRVGVHQAGVVFLSIFVLRGLSSTAAPGSSVQQLWGRLPGGKGMVRHRLEGVLAPGEVLVGEEGFAGHVEDGVAAVLILDDQLARLDFRLLEVKVVGEEGGRRAGRGGRRFRGWG